MCRRWRCGQRFVNFIIQVFNSVHEYHHQLHVILNFNGVFQFLGETGIIEINKQEENSLIKFMVLRGGGTSFAFPFAGIWEGLFLR